MPRWIEESAEGVVIRLHVQPRAKRTEIAGFHGESVKVKVGAPALEGRANEAVVLLVAAALGVAKSRVRILVGGKGREKVLAVDGIGLAEARERLERPPTA